MLDTTAIEGTTLFEVHQRRTRLEDRLHGRLLTALERTADLLILEAAKLAHQQGAALTLGQRSQVFDELLHPPPRTRVPDRIE
jgi:hypothetical protein